jgi:predicted ABC-type ATPase
MKKLYIVAGCNGVGKTSASYTILPEILDCKEFVNADEIAKGLSPFQPEKVSIEAGKVMLNRIKALINSGRNFAFETTLSTKSFVGLIKDAQQKGYQIHLIFLWLHSAQLAISRVKIRVKEGGHNIPEDVIKRRYKRGLSNFFNLYLPIVNNWIFINNSGEPYEIVAEGSSEEKVIDSKLWNKLKEKHHED